MTPQEAHNAATRLLEARRARYPHPNRPAASCPPCAAYEAAVADTIAAVLPFLPRPLTYGELRARADHPSR